MEHIDNRKTPTKWRKIGVFQKHFTPFEFKSTRRDRYTVCMLEHIRFMLGAMKQNDLRSKVLFIMRFSCDSYTVFSRMKIYCVPIPIDIDIEYTYTWCKIKKQIKKNINSNKNVLEKIWANVQLTDSGRQRISNILQTLWDLLIKLLKMLWSKCTKHEIYVINTRNIRFIFYLLWPFHTITNYKRSKKLNKFLFSR